jgi:hypothetical protein
LIPFALGTPFDISATVSFSVPKGSVGQLYGAYASAVLDFSFSIYGPGGLAGGPLVIEDASAVPEPGTVMLVGVGLLLIPLRRFA